MLKEIDLTDKSYNLSKKEYKAEIERLETRLSELQREIIDLKIPVIIAFEGWSASGKGTCISKILYPLDPRYFNVYTMDKVPEDVAMHPFLWNYWLKTPPNGRITIFDKSWTRSILHERQAKRPLSQSETDSFYHDVKAFERQLTDGGTLIIKLFLHISKDKQKRRFDELLKSPDTAWRVDKHDIEQNKNYETRLNYFDDMTKKSNFDFSKWNIIEADDEQYAAIKIYKTIIGAIEGKIDECVGANCVRPLPAKSDDIKYSGRTQFAPTETPPQIKPILSSINLDKDIEQNEYKEQLKYYQDKMAYLGFKLYAKRKPVVIVYEGWDAAGKGGNIKRLTQKLDPRGFEVTPVAAPSQEELAHHYLWRFWKAMPKDGHIAIFDRSWYGRVLVERVEHLCSDDDWNSAYTEINDMELHLHDHGAVIFKFWLHIDKDEQLNRFNMRQSEPSKQYKITDEDWRNRDKWDDYEKAVDEMIYKTSTDYAPWTIVESNSKKYARIKTLKLVVETLEEKLK